MATSKKKFTIYLMVPYCKWENIYASTEEEALNQVRKPIEFDENETHCFIAIPEGEEGDYASDQFRPSYSH